MRKTNYYLLSFASTTYALEAQKYLEGSINFTTMPTLRSITVSCGISLRIEIKDFNILIDLLSKNMEIRRKCRLYRITKGTLIEEIGLL